MTKQEFIEKIKNGLNGLSQEDIDKYVQYYSEMVDDRVEDGMDEASAVSAMGDIDAIVADILKEKTYCYQDNSHTSIPSKKKFYNNEKILWCIIAVLTSPVWVSLFAVVISVVVSILAVIISLYATSVALGVSSFAGVALSVFLMFKGIAFMQILMILGGFLVCLGVSILLFILSHYLVKSMAKLCKKCFLKRKESIKTKKEESL